MKASLFLFCICIVISCSSQYEFEDKIYKCTKETYQSAGIDSDQLMEDLEKYLIENNILKNKNPASYFQLIETILPPNLPQFSIPKEFETKLSSIVIMDKKCIGNIIDSTELKKSRLFEITENISLQYEKISTTGNLNPEILFSNLLKIFKKEDFQQPLFKLFFYHILYSYVSITSVDKGVLTKLPPWSEDEPDITKLKERNVFSVLVNAKNEILLRNKPIALKDLKMKAKEFISNPNQKSNLAESPTKAIISLKNDRGTKYKVYLEVLNELKAAYNELRDEKAMELYNLPYEELKKAQQKEIRKMIPLVISEAEPTAFGEEK